MFSLIIAVLLSLGVIQSENQFNPNSATQHQIYMDWTGEEDVSGL